MWGGITCLIVPIYVSGTRVYIDNSGNYPYLDHTVELAYTGAVMQVFGNSIFKYLSGSTWYSVNKPVIATSWIQASPDFI